MEPSCDQYYFKLQVTLFSLFNWFFLMILLDRCIDDAFKVLTWEKSWGYNTTCTNQHENWGLTATTNKFFKIFGFAYKHSLFSLPLLNFWILFSLFHFSMAKIFIPKWKLSAQVTVNKCCIALQGLVVSSSAAWPSG